MRNYIMAFVKLNPNLRAAAAAFGFACFAYFGVAAVLQNLYLLRLGFGADAIGLLNGSTQLMWAAAAFPASLFARRYGTRNALVLAYAVYGTAYTAFLMGEALPREGWFAWLMGCQVFLGIGMALTSTSIFPYLMAMASESERLHAFALQRLSTTLPTLLGSLAAGVLPGWLATVLNSADAAAPFRATLWLVVITEYAGALIMLQAKPAPLAQAPAYGSTNARVPPALFLAVGAVTLLMVVGEGSVRAFFNVFMDRALGADTAQIGLVVGITALFGVIVAFGSASILARLGAGHTIAIGVVGMGLGLTVIAFAPQWQVAGVGYVLMMTIASLNATSRNLFGQELAPAHARTTMAAVISIGAAAGLGGTAAVSGYLIGAIGFSGMFVTAGVVSLLAVPVILRLVAQSAPRPSIAPASAAK